MRVEAKLRALGLALPEPFRLPDGMRHPSAWVRVIGDRAYVSGQVPLESDGSLALPLGRVGAEVTPEHGYRAARLVALAHLANLRRELGDLDRVTRWVRVLAMVNAAPDFHQMTRVSNGYSDLILDLFGPTAGMHARSSVGLHVPLNAPISVEAEVEIDGPAA
jgi:enamine deaminase RidA (YjgF/YER057c/UK114 family)